MKVDIIIIYAIIKFGGFYCIIYTWEIVNVLGQIPEEHHMLRVTKKVLYLLF